MLLAQFADRDRRNGVSRTLHLAPPTRRFQMLVSSTVRYALSAVAYLAGRHEDGTGPVSMQQIAQATEVPSNYLSKLLHQLVQGGVLVSSRGPSGGFAFAVPPEKLVLARVVGLFTTFDSPTPCLLRDRGCDVSNPCVAHDRWSAIAREFRTYFEETTLATLLKGGDEEAGPSDPDPDA